MTDTYDYIVIGAGSAGCAVANRLSADPSNSVLLIEGGPPDKNMFIHMPRGHGKLFGPGNPIIWEYQVQTGGNGPTERWFRGKTLGGSSSVNGMIYMRGAPLDYNGWEALGCEGWGWDEVGPKFAELENHDQGADARAWRGQGGNLNITTHPNEGGKEGKLFEALLQAAEEMGIPRVNDVNNMEAVRDGGMGYQPTTRYQGRRFSSARAFLEPALGRPNLTILTDSKVLKIEVTDGRASGVKLRRPDGVRSISARGEIVLSAGAFETPKLLQLSGIGSGSLLQSLGIPVVSDLPNVGQNLRDHRHVDLRLRVNGGSQNLQLGGPSVAWHVLRYMLTQSGPMSHAAHEVGGFAKSTPGLDHADLQFGLMTLSASETGKGGGGVALDPFPGITFITYFTRPESQGEVRITSPDPDALPFINANHLATELDRQKFVAAFRWNRLYASQPALRDWVVEESYPGLQMQADDEILAHAMQLGGTCFHTLGTARMGSDPGAVVDPKLRVRGVRGLRVADTSIMPTMVSGNTNGPAMMVGLRAADFILGERAGRISKAS